MVHRRTANAGLRFPGEVVITESSDATDGTSTPAGEPGDDFFSSWDKPSIKKPTTPVSRTATPPVIGRTPSPFLSANGNGKDIARTASPLVNSESASDAPKPTASRITSSAALRKTAGTTGTRKTNVLGAKKTQKLGVKKVAGGDVIDFDEAEKKAKEEAERIEKLGYDPEAEDEAVKAVGSGNKADSTNILAPTPVSPSSGGYGSAASHKREKSASEMERLGMGIGRLGFGQVGGPKAAAAKKTGGGFGSVGPIKAAPEGKQMPRRDRQAGDPRDANHLAEQETTRSMLAASLARKSPSPRMSSSDVAPSTPTPLPKPRHACRDSKVPRRSALTPTLDAPRRTRQAVGRNMAISRRRPRTSSASSALQRATTSKTSPIWSVRVPVGYRVRLEVISAAERRELGRHC
jgi:hypothetical protein